MYMAQTEGKKKRAATAVEARDWSGALESENR
jgi:hypothetical protein